MPLHHHCTRLCLHEIDGILRRLALLKKRYPHRAAELAPRLDSALDERLRLMRLISTETPTDPTPRA
jgi:hypothetical protein